MGNTIAYIGTYTTSGSEGIYSCRFENGRLLQTALAARAENPTYLEIDDGLLFCVIETDTYNGRPGGGAASFRLDRAAGTLAPLGAVGTEGKGPCYIHADRRQGLLLTANYSGGSLSVFRLAGNGQILTPPYILSHHGRGPNPDRQEAPHVHFVDSIPGTDIYAAVDLGLDEISFYRPAANGGAPLRDAGFTIRLRPGCGPRHLAFSGNGAFLYALTELSTEIAVMQRGEDGIFHVRQYIPAAPGHTPFIGGGAVKLSADGKFLYASSRGDNTISHFRIDSKTGVPEFVSSTSCGGRMPRDIEIDPSGNWLLSANQNSDNIAVYRIDRSTGRLTQTDEFTDIRMPVCIKFTVLP